MSEVHTGLALLACTLSAVRCTLTQYPDPEPRPRTLNPDPPLRAARCALLAVVLTACDAVRETSARIFDNRTPRERYIARLDGAGFAHSAVARDWVAAVPRALREAPLVTSPHVEEGYLAPTDPAALAFRVLVRRGQDLTFEMQLSGDTASLLFLEAWQMELDSARTMRRIASADSGVRTLQVTPRRDGDVIVSAQVELMRGGRFTARVNVSPILAFPVPGGSESDIGSKFGASRDGGNRSHHGVDIFAPRGTPVIAAGPGYVSRVETTTIGGNVVWVRDDRGNNLYYAHLDRHNAVEGARVAVGDTVGFVGNTGNARTTPPHLHFGVYNRGPVDPYWYVYRARAPLTRLVADTTVLGTWARTPRDGIFLRAGPGAHADTLQSLPRYTALRVIAAIGEWYRVRLPDGTNGYVSSRMTEPASRAVRSATFATSTPLLARPSNRPATADVMSHIGPGDSVDVLGEFGRYLLVRASGKREGWLGNARRD